MTRYRYAMIAAAVVFLAAGIGAAMHHSRQARRRQIEQLLQDYASNPTEPGTDALAEMISVGEVPEDLGGRILETLLTPSVHKRSSYASGTEPVVVLEIPQAIYIHPASARLIMRLEHPDRPAPNHNGEIDIDPACCITGRFLLKGFPQEKGVHAALATIECTFKPGEYYHTWSWPGNGSFPGWLLPQRQKNSRPSDSVAYKCTVGIPIELNIVEPGREEKVRIVSSPDLAEAMKASLSATPDPYSISTEAQVELQGRILDAQCKGALEVSYRDLPENFAFSVSFIDSAGIMHKARDWSREERFTLIKGTKGTVTIHPPPANTLLPGKHEGRIILKALSEATDRYPEVKQIWGGTLEFPISFEVGTDPLPIHDVDSDD